MTDQISRIRLQMIKHRYSQRMAAAEIGMPIATFSSRITGKTEWKLSEIVVFSKLLGITVEQFVEYCG